MLYKAFVFIQTDIYVKTCTQEVHRNRHLEFRNLKIKNLQFSQFFQNQFEKKLQKFFQFSNFRNLVKLPNLNVKSID